jgi:cytochrome c5
MQNLSCRDRYASAVSSSDLTPRARSTLAPLDVLAAAGLAAQRQPLGMLLQRLRADATPTAKALAVAALAERLRAAVRRRLVRRDGADSAAVAADALAWWLDPTCLTCGGVRFAARDGRLTGRACSACHGSGQRALVSKAQDAAEWVVDTISQQVAMSETAHRRALR